jgi:hypothetical protein
MQRLVARILLVKSCFNAVTSKFGAGTKLPNNSANQQ